MEFSGNVVQPQEKIVTNNVFLNKESIFGLSFKYMCKTAVDLYIAGVDVE